MIVNLAAYAAWRSHDGVSGNFIDVYTIHRLSDGVIGIYVYENNEGYSHDVRVALLSLHYNNVPYLLGHNSRLEFV